MREWWSDWWPITVGITLFVMIMCALVSAIRAEEAEKKAKFNMCMNDIHNVYVCETWARGKDVEYIYITQ